MNEEQMTYVANLISQDLEKDKEINRLNNIIDELENFLNENWNKPMAEIYVSDVVKKIVELKEENDNTGS